MKRIVWVLLIVGFVSAAVPVRAQQDPAPLESYLRKLKAGFESLGRKSFERKSPTGRLERKFTATADLRSYLQFDSKGAKVLEWSIKSDGPTITYEAWYTPQHTKERLLEDDRNVSYTSFRDNGQKWEQYTYNKLKRLKAYYVYDKNGKLLQ